MTPSASVPSTARPLSAPRSNARNRPVFFMVHRSCMG
jgi:hypothetical protein